MWRFLVAVVGLSLMAPVSAETQRVEGLVFNRVVVHGAVDVEISQGDAIELVMRGTEEELARQPFFVEGDVLFLGRSQQHRREDFSGVQFKLTVKDLEHLELKGSGDVYVKPMTVRDFFASVVGSGDMKFFELRAEEARLLVSGSGDMQVADVSAPDLQVLVSGSGDMGLGQIAATTAEFSLNGSGDISSAKPGAVEVLEVNVVGSGDIDLEGLDSREAGVNIMGSGSARIGRTEELDVNIVGSGDVHFGGNPEISETIIGSGDLHRED
jgi:hypothetical protein